MIIANSSNKQILGIKKSDISINFSDIAKDDTVDKWAHDPLQTLKLS